MPDDVAALKQQVKVIARLLLLSFSAFPFSTVRWDLLFLSLNLLIQMAFLLYREPESNQKSLREDLNRCSLFPNMSHVSCKITGT